MHISNFIKNSTLLISAIGILSACNNKKNTDASTNNTTTEENSTVEKTSSKLAYIDIDTLETQYEYIVQEREKFEKEQKAIEAELGRLQKEIQNQYVSLQKKVQEKNISQEEYEKIGKRIQDMERNYQQKAEQQNAAMYKKTEAFQKDYREKIDAFLLEYNKDGKYDYIFSHQTGSPMILYVNPNDNITKDVVEGLNKKFKSGTTTTPTTSTDTTTK